MSKKPEMEPLIIISLMSGTSCDSIDVGLCQVFPDFSCKLLDGFNYKYPDEVKERIFNILLKGADLPEICKMNFIIGHCFAQGAKLMSEKHKEKKIDFISSHGQTIYHYPFNTKFANISEKRTLQIGEPSLIAQETGYMTIANFRTADISQGGQGAPLVCFSDEKWFKNKGKNYAIQNIGGISNVTVVSDKCDTFGFDNGLGNIMIDYCAKKYFGKEYDKNGEFASKGKINQEFLDYLLQDEYYSKPPPKTTGREYFSKEYIEKKLLKAPKDKYDIMATVTALTAKNIALSYKRFIYDKTNIDEMIIGGGGAYNLTLKKMIQDFLPKNILVKTHEDYGISNNFKEVMAFALLGYCTYYKIPNNVPSCTGAQKEVIMGQISYP